jgi:hypothetical protein
MKRVIFVVGVIALILGLVLYLSPIALSTLANGTGVSGSVVSTNKVLFLNVGPNNYTFEQVTLSSNNNLDVYYQSEPAGIEFLLMNQGNYSNFVTGAQSNVQIYSESKLNQANDSFLFTPGSTSAQNYYLVFKSLPGRDVTTNLELNLKIGAQVSAFDTIFIPYAILMIALILLVIGIFGGRQRRVETVSPVSQKGANATSPVLPVNDAKCRFCNAPMPSTMLFCPVCGKSQG